MQTFAWMRNLMIQFWNIITSQEYAFRSEFIFCRCTLCWSLYEMISTKLKRKKEISQSFKKMNECDARQFFMKRKFSQWFTMRQKQNLNFCVRPTQYGKQNIIWMYEKNLFATEKKGHFDSFYLLSIEMSQHGCIRARVFSQLALGIHSIAYTNCVDKSPNYLHIFAQAHTCFCLYICV